MNVALTWQQTVAIIAGIPMAVFGMLLFAPDLAKNRPTLGILFAISFLICAGFTGWHWYRTHRADLQPDVLARMVPAHCILELGRCHFYVAAGTSGSVVEIGGYIQNLNDGLGGIQLHFVERGSPRDNRLVLPPLVCDIPASGVVQFWGRFMCAGAAARTYKVSIEGFFRGSGRQVRFARRRVLSRSVDPSMTALALFAGAIYVGGGTFLSFTTQGSGAPAPALGPGEGQWGARAIWLPDRSQVPIDG